MAVSKGCRKRNSEDSLSSDPDKTPAKTKWPLWKKILVWSLVTLLILALLLFILIWIVVPVVFMMSIAFQRLVVFLPIDSPKNPNFNNPQAYNIEGVLNFYITMVDYHDNLTISMLGVWLIIPEDEMNTTTSEDILTVLRDTKYDILIYLHGIYVNRAQPIAQYGVMRKEFLVLAVDHRGYGDSGKYFEMTEIGISHDYLNIHDWLIKRNITKDIYYWGHSLGSALGCHALKLLKEERDFVPKGLILESPFTTLAEEIKNNFYGKVFKWLVYFNATMLKPLDDNGFHFYSSSYILSIDCPIMIMHAEDDRIVPWFLGKKLAHIAMTQRDMSKQGNVTFHSFQSSMGYGHNGIQRDVRVPQYIRDFKAVCQNFTTSTS